jgi:hypothetical protein
MRDFTDSFCERCGTRYTFGPPPAKGPSLATAKILARGLKNFVMNDSTTMDEAMAAARVDEERAHSSQVTEDFHRIFNFCMTCRQYACDKCWNPNQGACLSCAPLWDEEPVAPRDHLILRTPKASREPATSQRSGSPADEPLLGQPTLEELLASAASAREPQPERRRGRKQAPEPAESPAFEAAPVTPVTPAPPAPRPTVAERRAAVRDQKAAQELMAQSEAWQTQEDGWSLWPSEAGRSAEAAPRAGVPARQDQAAQAGGLNLTDEEYLLVQSELDHPSPYEEPDERTVSRGAAPQQREAHGPRPVEPPAAQPPPKFDLLGSLRQPTVGDEPGPAAPVGPRPGEHRGPVLGRLLGHHETPAASAAAGPAGTEAPAPAKAARAHKPPRAGRGRAAEAVTSPWPSPTPWSERPIERPDYWPDSDALAAAGSAEPVQPAEQASTFDQDLAPQQFEAPAAERQAEPPLPSTRPSAPVRRLAQRSQPQPPPPAEPQAQWPAAEATDVRAAQGAREEQPAWPPVAAPAPATRQPVAPWPVEDQTLAAASVVAARSHQDRAESDAAAQVEAMWAESAQHVLSQGSVRACRHCALPLSTHARFCRRCGADQQG